MEKLKYLWCVLLVILIPLSVLSLSGNIVLRLSETYVYHFNDSQVIRKLPTDLREVEIADEITSYLNSPDKDHFQVYEENGKFKDALFSKKDSRAMVQVKHWLTKSAIAGLIFIGASIALYAVMAKSRQKKLLRISGYLWTLFVGIGLVIFNIVLRRKSVRKAIYGKFVGVELARKSTLAFVLGDPFYSTFLLFFTMTAILITAIILYFNLKTSREERLFS